MSSERDRETNFFSEMEAREQQHLMVADEIHEEIAAIERSSRVEISGLAGYHNRLRMKHGWYYKWHQNKYADLTHYMILIGFCVLILLVIVITK